MGANDYVQSKEGIQHKEIICEYVEEVIYIAKEPEVDVVLNSNKDDDKQ